MEKFVCLIGFLCLGGALIRYGSYLDKQNDDDPSNDEELPGTVWVFGICGVVLMAGVYLRVIRREDDGETPYGLDHNIGSIFQGCSIM